MSHSFSQNNTLSIPEPVKASPVNANVVCVSKALTKTTIPPIIATTGTKGYNGTL